MNPSIETNLVEAIRSTRRSKTGVVHESFWMSSVGMCPRKQVAERAGIAPTHPLDFRSEFKMWTGGHLGQGIQRLLEGVGYLDPAWTERRVEYHGYTGKLDGLTPHVPGGAVVEIKTCDDRAVTNHTDFPEHYLWQGLSYCLATNIKTLLVFMLGKNQGLAKHRVFHLDEAWSKQITDEMDRMGKVWEMYVLHKVLPSHEHRYAFEDTYCPYRGETTEEVAQSLEEDADAVTH